MRRCHWLTPILMLAATALWATTAAELLQQGLTKETAEGDLEGAIAVYQTIVAEHGDDDAVAADAQLHIGLCYEKLGRREALAAYRQVLERFPDQAETAERARARLQALETADTRGQRLTGAGPEKTKARLAQLAAARAAVRSLRGRQVMTMEAMGQQLRAEGPVWFRQPDQLRTELTASVPAANSLSVFDGHTLWVHQKAMNAVTVIDVDTLAAEFPDERGRLVNNGICRPFDGLDPESLRFVRQDQVDGVPVYVFQGDADGRAARLGMGQAAPDWMEVAVGVEDGLARRLTGYRNSGAVMMRVEATIEATGETLPDSLFTFRMPVDAQRLDMTPTMRNLLSQATAPATPASSATPTPASVLDPGPVLEEIQAAADAITSWRAETRREIRMMGTTVTQTAKEWHEDGRVRQEVSMSNVPGTSISIQDSTDMWTWMPLMNTAQHIDRRRMDAAREARRAQQAQKEEDGPASFEGMVRDSIAVLGREELDGAPVYLLSGPASQTPKGLGLGDFGRVEIRIGAEDGLVRERLVYDRRDSIVIREVRTAVATGIDIPDTAFTFTPPEGAQVMELTDRILKQVEAMQAAED